MNLSFVDDWGIPRTCALPKEFAYFLATRAKRHGVSTQQVLLLAVASGQFFLEEAKDTVVTNPQEAREPFARAMEGFGSSFMRIVYADNKGGPICGAGEKPGSLRFQWQDGRFFEGVPQDSDVTMFLDDEDHVLTLEEIRQGTSPHIKKGDPVDLGLPEQKPPHFL